MVRRASLGLVTVFVLAGCPNWDALTEERCRELGATTGVCATDDPRPDAGPDAGVDAGSDAGQDAGLDAGPDAGLDAGVDAGEPGGPDASVPEDAGVDAGTPDAGPEPLVTWSSNGNTGFEVRSSIPTYSASALELTADRPSIPRRPAVVGVALSGHTFTVEDEGDAGFIFWIASSVSNRGDSPNRMFSAATNDRSNVVGTATVNSKVTVDSLGPTMQSSDWNFGASVPAMAQVMLPDGGSAFIGANAETNSLLFTSTQCANCAANTSSYPLQNATIDSAASDSDDVAWFSLRVGTNLAAREVRVMRATVALTPLQPITLQGSSTNGKTLIASATASTQASAHVAWVSGDTLHLAGLQNLNVLHEDTFDFGDPVQLLTLAENGTTTVAVVSVAGLHLVVLHRHGESPVFFRLEAIAGFAPSASHVSDRLRIAGACTSADGGLVNCDGSSNHVLLWDTLPNGGTW